MITTRVGALVAIASLLLAGVAGAQEIKIASVNPARAFNDMQETRDLKQKLDAERVDFETQLQMRQDQLRKLQAQRDLLKPDAPQFVDADRDLMRAAIDLDAWTRITQAQAQRNQKIQMKLLFDKIVAATGEIAREQGLDLVIAEQVPELPENLDQINVDQLRAAINSRNVLFVNARIDITDAVIARLDAQYRAGNAR